MAEIKSLLYNNSLKNFIQNININSKQRNALISKLPQMDLEERINLFKTLTKIYLLDMEEKEALERIDKFWEE